MNKVRRVSLFLFLYVMCAAFGHAQERARTVMTPAHAASSIVTSNPTQAAVSLPPTYIPANSKVYVADIFVGYENYLLAAFQKKKVPLYLTTNRSEADFEITGYSESRKANWAKIIFGSGLPEETASIRVVNVRTGIIAYAVASYKVDAINGKKSTAEHLAKNLKQKMERDDKRLFGK
jgi:hypothetical protein